MRCKDTRPLSCIDLYLKSPRKCVVDATSRDHHSTNSLLLFHEKSLGLLSYDKFVFFIINAFSSIYLFGERSSRLTRRLATTVTATVISSVKIQFSNPGNPSESQMERFCILPSSVISESFFYSSRFIVDINIDR